MVVVVVVVVVINDVVGEVRSDRLVVEEAGFEEFPGRLDDDTDDETSTDDSNVLTGTDPIKEVFHAFHC